MGERESEWKRERKVRERICVCAKNDNEARNKEKRKHRTSSKFYKQRVNQVNVLAVKMSVLYIFLSHSSSSSLSISLPTNSHPLFYIHSLHSSRKHSSSESWKRLRNTNCSRTEHEERPSFVHSMVDSFRIFSYCTLLGSQCEWMMLRIRHGLHLKFSHRTWRCTTQPIYLYTLIVSEYRN